MSRILLQLVAVLLIASTALSAPSTQNSLKPDIRMQEMKGYQNDSSVYTTEVSNEINSSDGPRTLVMYGMLTWLLGIVKAMIRPVKNMYNSMMPEITAFRCLSNSREFQNMMGFSGDDFEGYVYETPRRSKSYDQGFSNAIDGPEYQPEIPRNSRKSPDMQNSSDKFHDLPANPLGESHQRRADEVLKRIPRFIDEFASLLKEGQAMSCIMPYMRERVTRWIDSV